MRISTNSQGFEMTGAIEEFLLNELELAFKRFGGQLISVEVFMKDINGPKGGADKQVIIQARLRNRQRVALETTHTNLYAAIKTGVRKSRRAIQRSLRKTARIERLSLRNAMKDGHVAA